MDQPTIAGPVIDRDGTDDYLILAWYHDTIRGKVRTNKNNKNWLLMTSATTMNRKLATP